MNSKRKSNIPLEVWLPVIYIFMGGMWIVFSDKLLFSFVGGDVSEFARLQTAKGWMYVAVTGIMLFILLRIYNVRRKKYIKLIEDARNNAEKANKLKSTFLANISHELRTPMNAINGFSELIKQYVANPDVSNQYHSIVRENSLKLLKIIENIVDMSKIQVNLLKLSPRTFTLEELCSTLRNNTESMIPQDRLMHFIKPPGEAPVLNTDYDRLLQVCEILVLNSISNPGKGTLVLSCHTIEGKFAIDIHWEKSVKDTELQMAADTDKLYLDDSIGWDIANGVVKLLKGTISAHRLSDNTYRFLMIIPQNI
jgi:signal transduction histidine kinase